MMRDPVSRALAGEHVSELPPACRAVITRLLERLRRDLIDRAADALEREGVAEFERVWREGAAEILDEFDAAMERALAESAASSAEQGGEA